MTQTFEVRVAGLVAEEDLEALGADAVHVEPGGTVLQGTLVDQAALFGLFARLRAFGLQLVEVRRVAGPCRGGIPRQAQSGIKT
jgi:hypothetical protein